MEFLDTTGGAPTSRDPWHSLRVHTGARIALGRAGGSVRTQDLLDFRLAHARARDAVTQHFDSEGVLRHLKDSGLSVLQLASRATTRRDFLLRPDLGRELSETSRSSLSSLEKGVDVQPVLSDGLSPLAAERHGARFLAALSGWLHAYGLRIGPVLVVPFGRVKLQDEIGSTVGARVTVMALGERPGLGAPDSLGVYFTLNPNPNATDADRNCISNVRPEGLPVHEAAEKVARLVFTALARGVSGVGLKDDETLAALPSRDVSIE